MGQGAAWPDQIVEIWVAPPTVHVGRDLALGAALFCQVYTESGGTVKLPGWGQAHLVALKDDDVIVFSIFAAENELEFDAHRRQNYAQVYIPWPDVKEAVTQGEEIFCLGLEPGASWLGHSGSLQDYSEAFKRATELALSDAATPHVRVSMRTRELRSLDPELRRLAKLQNKEEQGNVQESPQAASVFPGGRRGSPVLPSTSMGSLNARGLDSINEAYDGGRPLPSRSESVIERMAFERQRASSPVASVSSQQREAWWANSSVASVSTGWSVSEAPTTASIGFGTGPRGRQAERLRQALFQNYALKTELQTVMRELELANTGLSPEERSMQLGANASAPPPPPSLGAPPPLQGAPTRSSPSSAAVEPQMPTWNQAKADEEAELDRQAAAFMIQIQDIQESNLELHTRYEGQIKALEQELVAAKLQASLVKEQAKRNMCEAANRGLASSRQQAGLGAASVPQAGLAALHVSLSALRGEMAQHSLQKKPGLTQQLGAESVLSEAQKREYDELSQVQKVLGQELAAIKRTVQALDHKAMRLKEVNETLRQHADHARSMVGSGSTKAGTSPQGLSTEATAEVNGATAIDPRLLLQTSPLVVAQSWSAPSGSLAPAQVAATVSGSRQLPRPSVGDTVTIMAGRYAGRSGKIVRDDKDFKPFVIEGLDGHFREEDVVVDRIAAPSALLQPAMSSVPRAVAAAQ